LSGLIGQDAPQNTSVRNIRLACVRRMMVNHWALLSTWIRTNFLPSDHSLEQLTERTDKWLGAQGLDTLSATRLEKLLRAEVLYAITDCVSGL